MPFGVGVGPNEILAPAPMRFTTKRYNDATAHDQMHPGHVPRRWTDHSATHFTANIGVEAPETATILTKPCKEFKEFCRRALRKLSMRKTE